MRIKRERKKRVLYLKKVFIAETKRLIMLLEKEFDFKRFYLFGSVVTAKGCNIHSDIDLAIEGLKGARFDIVLKPFEELNKGLTRCIFWVNFLKTFV